MADLYVETGSGQVFESAPESPADVEAIQGQLKSGEARPATEAEGKAFLERRAFQEAHGGLRGTVEATGLGFLRGLTLGLSDPVAAALGQAETVRGIQESHPSASTASELFGNVLPLVATGGESAAARGLLGGLGAPVRAVSRVGRAIEGLGAEAGLAGRMAAKVGAGAAEGALYEVGHQISEASLDPNWSAQAALGEIGLQAALGGGLAGAFGIVGEGLQSGAKWLKSRGLEDKALDYVARANNTSRADIDLIAKGEKEFKHIVDSPAEREAFDLKRINALRLAERETGEAMRELGTSKYERVAKLIGEVSEEQTQKARDAAMSLRETIARKLGEASARPELYGSSLGELQNWLERFDSHIAPHLNQPRVGPLGEAVGENIKPWSAPELFQELDKFKKDMDWKKYKVWDKDPALTTPMELAFKNIRGENKDLLERQDLWGKAAEMQARVNKAHTEWFDALKAAESEFGNRRLAAAGGFEDAGWDAKKLNSLGTQGADLRGDERQLIMDTYIAKTAQLINEARKEGGEFGRFANKEAWGKLTEAFKDIEEHRRFDQYSARVKPSRMSAGSSGMPISPGKSVLTGAIETAKSAAIGHALSTGAGLGIPGLGIAAGALEATKHIRDILHDAPAATSLVVRLGMHAEEVQARITKIAKNYLRPGDLGGLTSHALSIGDKRETFESRRKKVLAMSHEAIPGALHDLVTTHAPSTSAHMAAGMANGIAYLQNALPQPQSASPLVPPRAVSPSEKSRFMAQYDAVESPLRVLAGVPTREQMDAIGQVYPELLARTRQEALRALASTDPTRVPWAARQRLAVLLGQDVDGSLALAPDLDAIYATAHAQAQQQRQAAGAARMGLAKRLRSDEERREEK